MRIGVDVGGTKIEAAALDLSDQVAARLRVPTPRGDYPATVEAVAGIVRAIERDTGRQGTVGVGMPGSISPTTGLIKGSNSIWMTGQPFRDDLETALDRPVRCANDANCLAASEAHDGAAAGVSVVFAAVLGTGCGGGLALGGKVHEGRNTVAGEWGHNALPFRSGAELEQQPCFCGRSGCIETFLAGPLSRPTTAPAPATSCPPPLSPTWLRAAIRPPPKRCTPTKTASLERSGWSST